MIRRAFSLVPRPGELIRGDVRIPDGPPPRTAVVVVHGFKGFKDWGFFPYLCERLAAGGHAVVNFNFSRNGVGAGEDIHDLESFASNTLSLEQAELEMVMREVLQGELLPRRPRRLALVGHSRGGAQAILAAGTASAQVASLVTWGAVSTFDRWSEETKAEWREAGRVWILNQRTGVQMPLDVQLLEDFEANRERLDVEGAAARVLAPWLIVHGAEDITVPVAEAHRLFRAASTARMEIIEGAGHTFQASHPLETVPPELDAAVSATLRHLARIEGEA
ncbi:MAG: alpha/beta hydrolase family protein [Gemmatimonadota bacterium]